MEYAFEVPYISSNIPLPFDSAATYTVIPASMVPSPSVLSGDVIIHIHADLPLTIQPVSSLYIRAPSRIACFSSSYLSLRYIPAEDSRVSTPDLAIGSPNRLFSVTAIERIDCLPLNLKYR